MVFSNHIIFLWPAAAAAAAVTEDPLIRAKSFCRVLETPVPACHIHPLLAGQIWLQGAEIMGSSFSLIGASESKHETFAREMTHAK